MPIARFQTPDGRIARFEVPEGTSPEAAQAAIEAAMRSGGQAPNLAQQAGQQATADTPTWERGLVSLGRGLTDVGQGVKQIALHGSEAVGVVPRGTAAGYDQQVADELALYKPFEEQVAGSSIGRATGGALPTLLVPAGKAAQGVGAIVSKVLPQTGGRFGQSALLDAALLGGAQGVAMVADQGETHLGNALAGAVGAAGTVGGLTLAGKALTPAIRAIANRVNPAPVVSAGMTTAPATAAMRPELTQDTIRELEKQGIDVPSLTAEARSKLAQMAADTVQGAGVTPVELARQARMLSLPVPIAGTKGQITKDFAQNQLEQSLVKSSTAGAPIRERFATQEDQLKANLDAFRQQTGAKAVTEGDVGRSVDAATQARIDKSKANINSLYRAAEKQGDTLAPVDTAPLVNWLTDNGAAAASVPAIKSIADTMRKFGAVAFDEAGNAIAGRPLSINEAEEIRKLAVKLGKSDDATGHFMGEVKKTIDGMTEGAGGQAYQAARAARIQHALQFEEPGVVQNVVGMKSRTDRSVPFEDVFKKTVINGSIDDLRTLKGTLLANDKDTREAGVQAFKDLRGGAMQYLKDAATNNAHGDTSEAALRRAYNQIGPEKMRELFGGNVAKQFENFLAAVSDLKVPPKSTFNPSGTAGELMNWVDRILGFIPGAGTAVKVGTKLAGKAAEAVQASSNAAAAVNPNVGANQAATVAQQNERVKALLDSEGARRAKRYLGAVGAAAAAQQ